MFCSIGIKYVHAQRVPDMSQKTKFRHLSMEVEIWWFGVASVETPLVYCTGLTMQWTLKSIKKQSKIICWHIPNQKRHEDEFFSRIMIQNTRMNSWRGSLRTKKNRFWNSHRNLLTSTRLNIYGSTLKKQQTAADPKKRWLFQCFSSSMEQYQVWCFELA